MTTPNTQFENIPQELRDRPQWVTWKYDATQRKIPYDAKSGKAASSTDPATWATYTQARAAAARRHQSGIGYVFTADDPYTGIDLDDCLDAAGQLADWARAIITTMQTYTEVSPSGTGVKLWVIGRVPGSVKIPPIEIYTQARYFTVTGNTLPSTPATIRTVNGALTHLYERLRPSRSTPELPPLPPCDVERDHARRWALAALTGEREKMLTAGDGGRHNQRFDSAMALGGLIPHLTEDEIFDALAVNFGQNQTSAEKTIRDGIRHGRAYPRAIPAPRTANMQIACCPDDELDTLDAAALRQQVRAARADAAHWKQQATKLEAWRAWAMTIASIKTEDLSPAAKVVALTLWPEMQSRAEHGIDMPRGVYIEDKKDTAGLSAGTYGAKLKELAEVGALVRRVDRDPLTGNKKVLIQPAAFAEPAAWAPPTKRNHGGDHRPTRPAPSCDTCPPDAPVLETIVKTVTFTCACGKLGVFA